MCAHGARRRIGEVIAAEIVIEIERRQLHESAPILSLIEKREVVGEIRVLSSDVLLQIQLVGGVVRSDIIGTIRPCHQGE